MTSGMPCMTVLTVWPSASPNIGVTDSTDPQHGSSTNHNKLRFSTQSKDARMRRILPTWKETKVVAS